VSPDTREKIIRAATQLGYFVQKRNKPVVSRSVPSRPPSGDRNTTIVLIPNVREQTRQSTFWGRIIDGITTGPEENHLGMMIVTEHISDNFTKLINPDAVLGLVGVGLISNQLLLDVRNLGIPFMLVDHEDSLIPSDVLFMNNYECIRRATNYLLGSGHRKLQFVGDIRYSRSFYDRWLGFRSMLEEQDVELEYRGRRSIFADFEHGAREQGSARSTFGRDAPMANRPSRRSEGENSARGGFCPAGIDDRGPSVII
jgi:LacI family transcriptional regulator